jgi:GTP-binding protein
MRVLAARGGRGGRGNKSFKTAMNTAPRIYEKGQPSETATLELELKLIADVGIIGVPNAGKSSILAGITAARPKIASYPFTTLSPNLGVATIRSKNVVFADIPGLIEGARDGKGLGHDFLRHIERTGLLLHVVDASGASGDPLENYKTLIAELGAHSKELIKKPTVIALNKMDVPESARVPALFRRRLKGKKIFPVSAVTGDGLSTLMDYCARHAAKRGMTPSVALDDNPTRRFTYEKPFTVERNGDVWVLSGKRIDDLAEMTDFASEETLVRFQHIIKKMGIDKALQDAGAVEGDTVRIGSKEFDFEI